jgi:hypothetical protein
MTKQLALISLPAPDARPAGEQEAGTTSSSPTTPSTGRRRTARGPAAAPARSAGHPGWLDRRTIETGKQGLASARAALADATRRAHERDQEREAARVQELARQADVTRHPAARHRRAA